MTPSAIVEILNVGLHIVGSLIPIPVLATMHPLFLQAAEEAFHGSIIVQSPLRLMLHTASTAANWAWYSYAAYVEPRSE